ncbi:hypothetical protein Pmar_PMAR023690 [Perkinsus marinus ATCC 50983]|uniref:Uncharacterized protein n=1 Tax=Perkinsus marinus (strain ATCC 50983 / TXsc) TaxID=423536 RepID=C5KD11_PERM5|nr:hypothetical protein Pmar_PMAR023690 [Perkinsus marinus ATCC 50983]EER17760.1 hypothetical protein Pmar_PMAR023690 [Perkinsus marinus ATCC 50983]|eukprot:XP_002785964.1 hypothetical protein Pmar_PMAR023690 [Perkinsus marinus ATCC 50983]
MMTMQVKAPSRSPRVYRGSVAVKGALFDQAETRTKKVMEATEEPLQIVARESTEVKVASCDTRRRSKSFNRGLTLADTASPFSKNRAVLLAALAKEEGVDSLAPGHLVSYADAIQSVEGKCYSMVLCAGNNHTMIERMLSQTRPWWRVVVTSQNSYSEFCSSIFNLKWKQSLPNATDTLRRMANAVDLGGATVCQPQLVNYFGGCHELCTKANLLRNLAKYCGEVKINLWEIMPVSIIIRLKRCDADADQDSTPCGLEDYVLATEVITRVASLGATERTTIDLKGDFPSSNDQICVRVPSSLCTGNNRFLLLDGENHHPYSVSRLITSRVATSPSSMLAGLTVKYSMPSSFIPESSNMAPQWMLKPAALSRGRGIKVIRTEAELRRFVLKKDSPHSKALRRVISSGLPELQRSSIRRGRSLSVGPLVGKSKTRRSLSTKVSEACQPCVAEKREEEKVERLRSNSMASTAASSSPSNSKEQECLSTVQEGDAELSEASPMITVARESSIPVVSKVRKTEGKKGSNGNWVLQKYIDRPMLINQRKFDIRMWLVLTPSLHAYCYREGYIRTASVSYDPSRENSVVDEMMHLCNNAIQKRGDKYGLYENGNQMSFDALQAYADENAGRPNCPSKLDVHGKMRAAMYRAMAISLHATLRQFRSPNSNSFQIFGYDFMIDQDGGVWLIEIVENSPQRAERQLWAGCRGGFWDERDQADPVSLGVRRTEFAKETSGKCETKCNSLSGSVESEPQEMSSYKLLNN